MGITQLFLKAFRCIRDRRLPWVIEENWAKAKVLCYGFKLRFLTGWHNLFNFPEASVHKGKFLYVSAVGAAGKELLAKLIENFGHDDFDYLIFVYDQTDFNDEVFSKCHFIYEKGMKWQLARKYLTAEYCKNYPYIFIWDDDIDSSDFSYKNFVRIMENNNLELAQPALSSHSFYSHELTLRNNMTKVGRYTDFVEVMVMVFRQDAWPRFFKMVSSTDQSRGWGFDLLAKSVCKYTNMGIVDAENVTHTRPVQSQHTTGPEEMKRLHRQYRGYKIAEKIAYAELL